MPMSLTHVDALQEHLMGVVERSAHHAGDVNEVLLSLVGAMMWRKNPDDPFKVNTKEGAGGNVIWFRVDQTRYALLYSHEERIIKLVEGRRKGEVIETFTNDTTTNQVAVVFANLGKSVTELSKARKVRKEDRDPNAPKPAKADKAPKDPKIKEARQLAKAAKAGKAAKDGKAARDPETKAARIAAREAKVKARREERKVTRAAEKEAKTVAQAAPVVALAEPQVAAGVAHG